MKKYILRLFSGIICLAVLVCASACGSVNTVKTDGNLLVKYSTDGKNWNDIEKSTDFSAELNGGQAEIIYFQLINRSDDSVYYKISANMKSGKADNALIGFAEDTFDLSSHQAAIEKVENTAKPLKEGMVKAGLIDVDDSIVLTAVVYEPESGSGAKFKLGFDIIAEIFDQQSGGNTAVAEDGKFLVYAQAFAAANSGSDTCVINEDGSFKLTFAKDVLASGTFITATVTPDTHQDDSVSYDIKIICDGTDITDTAATVNMLVGYGLMSAEVYFGETKIENAAYDQFTGSLTFPIASSGKYTVKYTKSSDTSKVKVSGSDTLFEDLNAAIDYSLQNTAQDTVTYIIYGNVSYKVNEGQKVAYTNGKIKKINIVGAPSTSQIIIDGASGSLPSLPEAPVGVQITYSNITFDSQKTADVTYIDYRGEADITFRNCIFKKGLATRGANSNVTVDNCDFKAATLADTFKGYSYYSMTVDGKGNAIKVNFTNNNVTESWGGINLDWVKADFYVANNTFANLNCSKPAIQLSRAENMVIEYNTFENIKDENAFRFYSAYNAEYTYICNNKIDVDYLFYTDKADVINSLYEFVFEDNTITATTDMENGHVTNDKAGVTAAHNYEVDTDSNTIV